MGLCCPLVAGEEAFLLRVPNSLPPFAPGKTGSAIVHLVVEAKQSVSDLARHSFPGYLCTTYSDVLDFPPPLNGGYSSPRWIPRPGLGPTIFYPDVNPGHLPSYHLSSADLSSPKAATEAFQFLVLPQDLCTYSSHCLVPLFP